MPCCVLLLSTRDDDRNVDIVLELDRLNDLDGLLVMALRDSELSLLTVNRLNSALRCSTITCVRAEDCSVILTVVL